MEESARSLVNGPEEEGDEYPGYSRVSFSRNSVNHPGIQSGLRMLLSVDAGAIIRSSSNISISGVPMPQKRSFFLNNSRKELLQHMTPVSVIETLSDLSDKYLLAPMVYRTATFICQGKSDTMQSIKLSFQASSGKVDRIVQNYSLSLWLIHRPRYSEGAPKTIDFKLFPEELTKKATLVFMKLTPDQKKEPIGATPCTWPDENNVFPDLCEPTTIVNCTAYFVEKNRFVDSVLLGNRDHEWKVGLTFIGKMSQFLKSLRMFTLPDLPPELSPDKDYNVCPLFDMIVKGGPLSNIVYQPALTFEEKFHQFMSATEASVLLLDGAPGTGKSSKTVGVITSYIRNCSLNSRPIPQILVTAPSNAATDILFMKLINGFKPSDNIAVVRVGEKNKFSSKARLIVEKAENDFRDAFLREHIDEDEPPSENEMNREYLMRANIIVSTLGSSQMVDLTNSRNHLSFDLLVIDECGQASFGEFLYPMHFTTIKKLLLMGDPRQLGPIVKWIGFYNYKPHETSIFVNLYDRLKTQSSESVVVLREQYRMRKAVAEIISAISYNDLREGALIQAPSGNWKRTLALPEIAVFSGENWVESRSGYTFSYENTKEALFGMLLLLASLKQAGFDLNTRRWPDSRRPLKYAVISLYMGQVILFTRLIKEYGLEDVVTVSTVDQMQGSEADVVIVSAVRAAEDDSSVGFANDIRRLTVAISRAACVYILAHYDSFKEEIGWQKLFQYVNKYDRGFYRADLIKEIDEVYHLLEHFASDPIYKGC